MKNKCAVTIVTWDYLDKGLSTMQSMKEHGPQQDLYVFTVDENDQFEKGKEIFKSMGINLIGWEDFDFQELRKKYAGDQLRWAMKPALIEKMLNKHESVLMVDSDIHFYDKFDFLYDFEGFELIPHWRNTDPGNSTEFQISLQHGYFNAGFVGFTSKGLDACKWWAKSCHWKCEINPSLGVYVDQKYLDMLPYHFPETSNIVKHRGCNVAFWNKTENQRCMGESNSVTINNEYPIIFIHFAENTISEPSLKHYSEIYKLATKESNRILIESGLSRNSKIKTWGVYESKNGQWEGPVNGQFYLMNDAMKLLNSKNGNGRKYQISSIDEIIQTPKIEP